MLAKDPSHRCQSILEPLNEFVKESSQPCPQCAAPNPMSNSFCGQCGSALRVTTGADSIAAKPRQARTAAELTDEGFLHTKNDEIERAVGCYEAAIKLAPTYARAYANLGFVLNKQGEYERAIEILSKGIEISNDSAILHRLHDNRGFARSNLKHYEDAIADFTTALEHNPNNPRVYYHRAESKALAEHYEDAYSDVLRALRIDPDHYRALRLRDKLEGQGLVKSLRVAPVNAS
jgi:tetratricopeptide (TPR) repeat protein